MLKNSRLEYIRSRAKETIPLSHEAATLLEQLQREDPDIGSADAYGETLSPDDIRAYKPEATQDEENEFTDLLSPSMRAVIE